MRRLIATVKLHYTWKTTPETLNGQSFMIDYKPYRESRFENLSHKGS
jgi:hypothetical protein